MAESLASARRGEGGFFSVAGIRLECLVSVFVGPFEGETLCSRRGETSCTTALSFSALSGVRDAGAFS